MDVGQIDRGASLAWISLFPAEEEVLLPPLCSLEATGSARYEQVAVAASPGAQPSRRTVMVWPVRVNVNLKGKTVEEHQATRKTLLAQMAENAEREVAAELARGSASQKVRFKELREEVRAQSAAVIEAFRAQPEQHFNDDAKYSAALQDVLQLKPWAARVLACAREGAVCGVSVDELRRMQIMEHLPSAEASSGSETAFAKALAGLCARRGLFTQHIEETDANGRSALGRSVAEGRLEDVALLLACGAQVDARDKTADGCTPVYIAAEQGQTEAMARLIEAKCDVDKAASNSFTP
eukprot:232136-Rhodomonas_salina.1